MAGEGADVFVSYKAEDRRRLKPLIDALEAEGFSVWWDVHIRAGDHWRSDIEEQLDAAKCVLVAWTDRSVSRDGNFVRDEAARAQKRRTYLPICLDPVDPPLGFGEIQAISLKGWKGNLADPGYRALVDAVRSRITASDSEIDTPVIARARLSRRSAIIGVGTSAALIGSVAYWWRGEQVERVDAKAVSLLDQAWQSWSQGTNEGNIQAIGLYRRATSISPDYADAWGFLGCAYGDRGHTWVTGEERDECWQRAREAGRHALECDSKNAYGRAAIAYARPRRGNWGLMDREFRRAQQDQPDKWLIVYSLGLLMGDVGRYAEAARLFASLKGTAPTATQYQWHVQALWASAQLDAAERLLDDALGIYGSSAGIWWQHFDMLLNGGRPAAAIALTNDRPAALDDREIDQALAVARASLSRDAGEIAAVTAKLREEAVKGADLAGRAIEYASFLGQVDQAFEIAEALYFSGGFTVADLSAQSGNSARISLDERRPRILFLPSTRSLRADARFEPLVAKLGLTRYWQETGSVPDYRYF